MASHTCNFFCGNAKKGKLEEEEAPGKAAAAAEWRGDRPPGGASVAAPLKTRRPAPLRPSLVRRQPFVNEELITLRTPTPPPPPTPTPHLVSLGYRRRRFTCFFFGGGVLPSFSLTPRRRTGPHLHTIVVVALYRDSFAYPVRGSVGTIFTEFFFVAEFFSHATPRRRAGAHLHPVVEVADF